MERNGEERDKIEDDTRSGEERRGEGSDDGVEGRSYLPITHALEYFNPQTAYI